MRFGFSDIPAVMDTGYDSVRVWYFILCVLVLYLHVGVCTTQMPGTQGAQKKASDPMVLKLRMALNTM